MPYGTIKALVLRRSNYRENDRIISLLTPDIGKVDALARGARKLKSPLLAATEPAVLGEFVLYKGKGHTIVTAFNLEDNFFPLRKDIERFSHAALMLSACDAVARENEEAKHLFILAVRSLSRLSYSDMAANLISSAFLLHFSTIEGFKPRLNHCSLCEKPFKLDDSTLLDPLSGGLICKTCSIGKKAPYISPEQATWLRQVLIDGVDEVAPIADPPIAALINYVQVFIDKKLPKIISF